MRMFHRADDPEHDIPEEKIRARIMDCLYKGFEEVDIQIFLAEFFVDMDTRTAKEMIDDVFRKWCIAVFSDL